MKTPNDMPQRTDEDLYIPSLRGRIGAIVAELIEAIEDDGPVLENGDPNPLLSSLADLIHAGTDLRRLAVERRALAFTQERLAVEQRRAEMARKRADLPYRVSLTVPQKVSE
ncbi:hypothetical protein ACFCXS_25670 [Streptomyces sp. NPDC056373]|uniref:hypothetical protein n=1 Tax=Streptomyces sp. NPDC056373 TaxID=3345798 RepID=UPI0035D6F4EB